MSPKILKDGVKRKKFIAKKRKKSKLVAKQRKKNPNAEELEKELRNIENFGGIFASTQLKDIIILKYPVIFLVIVKNHWIVLYLDKFTIEVYDSLMNICDYNEVLQFIRNNLFCKELKLFPKVQADDNLDCAFYATFFIKAKSKKMGFEKLLSLFNCNFEQNSKMVRAGFNENAYY